MLVLRQSARPRTNVQRGVTLTSAWYKTSARSSVAGSISGVNSHDRRCPLVRRRNVEYNGPFESRRNPLKKAFIVLCATVAGLLAAEGILHLWDIADPPAFVENPHYGFLMRPNQSASTRGYRFHINQFGLRGRDFAMPKPAGVYRIAFLGDSITYGGGRIPDPDLFVNVVASQVQMPSDRRAEAIQFSAQTGALRISLRMFSSWGSTVRTWWSGSFQPVTFAGRRLR